VETPDPSATPAELAAAEWLSRRDRGLSASEQDAYFQWLREDPAHGAAVARLEESWRRLDALRHWRPAHSAQPNPDLLAPRPRRRWLVPSTLAAAAAIVLIAFVCWPRLAPAPAAPRGAAVLHPGPERMTLADGSLVELNSGAEIAVDFTPARRSVRLVRGQAHFTVAKDTARPFVVSADTFEVRAVGTAFSVLVDDHALSVLVTEGKVQLDELRRSTSDSSSQKVAVPLTAGQEAVVRLDPRGDPASRLLVRELTPSDVETALAWQRMRLEFLDLALSDVVQEFNRYNSRKLVIGDDDTAGIRIAGSFRADNVEAFVRLLDAGFDIDARPRGGELVLTRRR
jgi:Fe2+-dicitrate sensor, membrane component